MSDRDFKDYNWPRLVVLLEPTAGDALTLTREVSNINKSKLCRAIITAWLRDVWGTDLSKAREKAGVMLQTQEDKGRLKKALAEHFRKLTIRGGEGTFQ